MSFFSILDFLDSGRRSLNDKNYYSALSVALMLPSMCSRLKYKGDLTYCYKNKKGKLCWHDREAYIAFCNAELANNGWLHMCFGSSVGEILYNLRCDMVHAGCADIYDDETAIWLSYGQNVTGITQFSKFKIVSIESICKSIFNGIENWARTFSAENFQYTLVFGESYDDRLLYQRLCDKERTDILEKEFLKGLAERNKIEQTVGDN